MTTLRQLFTRTTPEQNPIEPTLPVTHVQQLLSSITHHFFHPLVVLQAEQFSTTPEDREILEQSGDEDYLNWFNRELAHELRAFTQKNDGAEALTEYALTRLELDPSRLPDFTTQLLNIFSGTNTEGATRPDEIIMTALLTCLQRITLNIPQSRYQGSERITEPVQEAFSHILRDIEKILETNHLVDRLTASSPILRLAQALSELNVQIARADGHIWLPLRSLITAPLSRDELKLFYARDNAQADRLARQIVSNDGVVLVAGYRGVGKSTFINLVMEQFVPEIKRQQIVEPAWEIIPIRISLAKANNVANVLRICIRELCNTLLSSESVYESWLTPEEKSHLRLAYLRASYKYSQQQSETISNAIESKASLEANVGKLLPLITSIPLPGFEGAISRRWGKAVDQTVSLLDYDEDWAENDLVRVIELLQRPRLTNPNISPQSTSLWKRLFTNRALPQPYSKSSRRLKLVFIFDEMDKMDEEQGQEPLIKQLKNLFLTRYAVFVLVTSKRFYYRWLNQRKEEDSILASYFSSIIMVPLFSSMDTEAFLQKIIPVKIVGEAEKELLRVLAQYLTYRAMGVPREIIRELQAMQQWSTTELRPFLNEQCYQNRVVQIYARVQQILEEMDGLTSDVIAQVPAMPQSGESIGEGEPLNQSAIAPERFWINEAVREQIKRGRYVLIEELFNLSRLEWEEDMFTKQTNDSPANKLVSPLRRIYDNNFGMITATDFFHLLNELGVRLQTLTIDPKGVSSQESVQLITREINDSQNSSVRISLVVNPEFYRITGRRVTPTATPSVSIDEQKKSREPRQILGMLREKNRFETQVALSSLKSLNRNEARSWPEWAEIESHLYAIVVSEREDALRLDAIRLITKETLINNLRAESQPRLLVVETNENILRECLRLLHEGTNDENKAIVKTLLLRLLQREPSNTGSSSQSISEGLVIEIISALIQIDNKNLLAPVINSLNPQVPLTSSLIRLILQLAGTPKQSVLELLIRRGFTTLPTGSLTELLTRDFKTLNEEMIWGQIYPYRKNTLAQTCLAFTLTRLAGGNSVPPYVLKWLGGEIWQDEDRLILATATKADQRLQQFLGRDSETQSNQMVKERLASVLPKSTVVAPTKPSSQPISPTETTAPAAQTSSKLEMVAVLAMLCAIIVFILTFVLQPTDLPSDVGLSSRLWGRVIELIYLPFVGIGVLMVLLAFTSDEFRDGGSIVIMVVSLAIVLAGLAVLIFVLDHPVTFGGQLLLALTYVGVPTLAYLVIAGIGSLIRSIWS